MLTLIHRHIGGLERHKVNLPCCRSIHRHIGGLENRLKHFCQRPRIHRHIGGLEKNRRVIYLNKRAQPNNPAISLSKSRQAKMLFNARLSIGRNSSGTKARRYRIISIIHPTVASVTRRRVAPHTGAWIETGINQLSPKAYCRTPHGCVD